MAGHIKWSKVDPIMRRPRPGKARVTVGWCKKLTETVGIGSGLPGKPKPALGRRNCPRSESAGRNVKHTIKKIGERADKIRKPPAAEAASSYSKNQGTLAAAANVLSMLPPDRGVHRAPLALR